MKTCSSLLISFLDEKSSLFFLRSYPKQLKSELPVHRHYEVPKRGVGNSAHKERPVFPAPPKHDAVAGNRLQAVLNVPVVEIALQFHSLKSGVQTESALADIS